MKKKKEADRLPINEEKERVDRLVAEGMANRMKDSVTRLLEKCGFHDIANAFTKLKISFGDDERSVFGACPTDPMHAFQSGILMYITKMIVDKLGPKNQTMLDKLVENIMGQLRSSCKEEYPRYNFSKGFSKLSFVTSDEWVGKLFVLLIVALTEEGKHVVSRNMTSKDIDLGNVDAFKRKDALEQAELMEKNHKELRKRQNSTQQEEEEEVAGGGGHNTQMEEASRRCSYNDFIHLAESLLSFHAWYKISNAQTGGATDIEKIDKSVRRMLAMVKVYVPRKKGMHWCIQKFHDMLHLAEDIRRFGSPKNYDAGPLESSLRFWAKHFAQTAQKRGYNIFVKQVASRIYEQQCLLRARRRNGVEGVSDENLPQLDKEGNITNRKMEKRGGDPILGGSRYRIFLNRNAVEQSGRKNREADTRLEGVIEEATKNMMLKEMVAIPYQEEERAAFLEKHQYTEEKDKMPPYTDWSEKRGCNQVFYELFTECEFALTVEKGEGCRVRLRSHPNYNGAGAWRDWVMVRYQSEGEGGTEQEEVQPEAAMHRQYNRDYVPAKILGFFKHPVDQKVRVLVHPCEFRDVEDMKRQTVLTERWRKWYDVTELYTNGTRKVYNEMMTSLIELESIKNPCLVVEHDPRLLERFEEGQINEKRLKKPVEGQLWVNSVEEMKTVTLIRKRAEWGGKFTT